MRVGFYQFCPVFGDKEANLARVEQVVSQADADLIVLPELFSTGYGFGSREELSNLAEDLNTGPTATRLVEIARRTGTAIVGGIAERYGNALYNSSLSITPDGKMHIYRKIHLFQREKMIFDRSADGPEVWSLGANSQPAASTVLLGTMICFDYFFPELARTYALSGAQMICHPSNLILQHAQQMTVTRALENRVFWILANRIGFEEQAGVNLAFTGGSQIVAPDGEVLFRAGPDEEIARFVEIDPRDALNKVVGHDDLFEDRRPELYGLK